MNYENFLALLNNLSDDQKSRLEEFVILLDLLVEQVESDKKEIDKLKNENEVMKKLLETKGYMF